ncbi:hypothetical protein [Gordonia sp. YC-JH1]|uniref:hypothetical protein n=1 Tax=Gordonia sp. YC-JH1 TaxID=2059875 RepID=UPI0018F51001|nr:hypothetical protein [Gordonia sp. YC-JH1]
MGFRHSGQSTRGLYSNNAIGSLRLNEVERIRRMHSVQGGTVAVLEALLILMLVVYVWALVNIWPALDVKWGIVIAALLYGIVPWSFWFLLYLKSPVLTPKFMAIRVVQVDGGFDIDVGRTFGFVFLVPLISGVSMILSPIVSPAVLPGGGVSGRAPVIIGIALVVAYAALLTARSHTRIRLHSTTTTSLFLGITNVVSANNVRRIMLIRGGVARAVDGDYERKVSMGGRPYRHVQSPNVNIAIPVSVLNSPDGFSVEDLSAIAGIEVVRS